MSNEIINNKIDTNININEQTETTEPNQDYITFEQFKAEYENGKEIYEILKINKYLPTDYKQVLIDRIISSATELNDNNMTKINYVSLELFKTIHMLEAYTNLIFDRQQAVKQYDDWVSMRLHLDEIIGEWDYINDVLDRELDQLLAIENSMESIVNNHLFMFQDKLDMLISKIPNLDEKFITKIVNKMTNTLKNFKSDDVKLVNELSNFVKGKGK